MPRKSSFGKVTLMKMSEISLVKHPVLASMNAPSIPTKVAESSSILAHCWKEIQGLNNWENLMEPLDPLLQKEIIRYGEFIAAYYEVTKYIYATPDIKIPSQNSAMCGRWIGYVAVSSSNERRRIGRRDIVITFRGTVTNPEWIANLMSSLTPARLDPHNPRPHVMVETGFLSLYASDESGSKFGLGSCREQLLSEVSRLLNKYKGEEMSITLAGHSMGSSLALLLAYDIAELGLNRHAFDREIPITVFSFGGRRVGNSSFKERCEELGVNVLRIVNVNDPITKLPGVFLNENFKGIGEGFEFP
ncbi:unnamed protein product [Ilex paraguariensis]|uniref:Fungal lipase-type domain-containing protein n=1 Tax=Ilex paraguariensis TaxID=185542 RepID=A0ABC8TB76_9AQUA